MNVILKRIKKVIASNEVDIDDCTTWTDDVWKEALIKYIKDNKQRVEANIRSTVEFEVQKSNGNFFNEIKDTAYNQEVYYKVIKELSRTLLKEDYERLAESLESIIVSKMEHKPRASKKVLISNIAASFEYEIDSIPIMLVNDELSDMYSNYINEIIEKRG